MTRTPLSELQEAQANGIVLGLKNVGNVVPRLDIDVLLDRYPDTFNLFLLAMRELQTMDPTDLFSYFQIAGIHGLPRRLWDGLGEKNKAKGPEVKFEEGYCAHNTPTFPTWHRLYLAMLEQALFLKMIDIADRWTDQADKERYRAAVYNFRLPFWDYYRARADNEVKFPGVIENGLASFPFDFSAPLAFTTPSLMVRMYPDDKQVLLEENPLFAYRFPSDTEIGIPPEDWKAAELANENDYSRELTQRYPLPQAEDPFHGSSVEAMNAVLNSLRMDSARLAISMVSDQKYANYNEFSNDRKPSQPSPEKAFPSVKYVYDKASGSLESIHDMYHLLIGGNSPGMDKITRGGGHMSQVPIAAFDPIFWMHHGQIERLFTIWQKAHEGDPESWFHGTAASQADDGLYPFRKQVGRDETDMWNSNEVRDSTTLGYTYEDVLMPSGEVAKAFAAKYDWAIPDTQKVPTSPAKEEMIKKRPLSMKPIDVRASPFFQHLEASAPPLKDLSIAPVSPEEKVPATLPQKSIEVGTQVNDDGIRREWYIDDDVERLAYNGAFTVYYFLSNSANGAAPVKSEQFLMADSLVGLHHVFASPTAVCRKCRNQQKEKTIVSTTIPITSKLMDFVRMGYISSLEEEEVTALLKKSLKWRIEKTQDGIKNPQTMPTDKVFRVGISCKSTSASGEVTYKGYPGVIEAIVQDGWSRKYRTSKL